jgi:hypothetical protein
MTLEQRRPFVARAEREPLPPVSREDRLQAIAGPDEQESEPSRRVRFSNDERAARPKTCRRALDETLLRVARHHVEHVEDQHRAARRQFIRARVGDHDLRGIAESPPRDGGRSRAQLDADQSIEPRHA